jgi:ribosomal protein L11 methyltransferase
VDDDDRAAAVDVLIALGARAVEEKSDAVVTHFPPPEDPEALITELRGLLREDGVLRAEVSHSWQPHQDWEQLWRQGLGFRRISDRIGVLPSWCRPREPLPEVTIVIDPGMAFGTAEHATTRGSLRLLDQAVSPGDRVLDAGAGSAILSIAAAKLGAKQVTAVELDPYACEAARENVRRNAARTVEVVEAVVTRGWLAAEAPYDGIVANIQRHALLPLLRPFRRTLTPEGWLILSGILDTEWPEVQAAAAGSGFSVISVDAEEEWRSGWFTASA